MSKTAKLQAAVERNEQNISARFQEISKRSSGKLLLSDIQPDPTQPRRSFQSDAQLGFEQSIAQQGVLQPILVERHGDKYQIIAGERRYRAALKAGFEDIPAVIRDELPSSQKLEYQLLENIMRQDLNPVDKADAMLRLMMLRADISEEMILKDISTRYRDTSIPSEVSPVVDAVLGQFNIALSTFHRFYLKLLKLPEDLQNVIRSGELDYSFALLLEKVTPEQVRANWVKRIIDEGLSREALKKLLVQKKVKPIKPTNQTIKKQLKQLGKHLEVIELAEVNWLEEQLKQIQAELQKRIRSSGGEKA